ncbi:DNA polymerase III subunit gamma and tau [Corynebacterium lubricantis]|uniref:DNA polymerase III subunit gamma and tau n=1 Tax=Corynebacterium lubricantis TaxID=541095 RepID=UPI0003A1AC3F|nr:DNA polymerase III subunit gamma and tau [Corynebacterium lubricantis]
MALYRKYRPATFAEVVGQEQVTRPLSNALDSGRINHAYLFSGPRGCGKTSSARILARSLNCVEGPTSTPCGVCPSCVSLAPGGSGNLDVTELDAASNRGVEDMRELRDRAYFAPAQSRYRVFIVDEAHMITAEGANALLKIVEEPPAHLIFIFATTEPEKIIGTIRSRTHHYPFRLLTPQAMRSLIERTVESEGVTVDPDVYPLVIRAGGGSPRDTLSLLDQLLSGSGPEGLTYEAALPLLGVTDEGYIDTMVDALATGDGASAYQVIDQVIEAGHEPRRFVADLLDRLRDLIVIQNVPNAFGQGLVNAPTDRAEVLTAEAARFHPAHLAQLAEEVNDRISAMRFTTSPRLLLEIMVAHLLVVPTSGAPATPAVSATPASGDSAAVPAQQRSQPARGGGAAAAQAAAAAAAAGKPKSSSTPAPRQAPRPEPAQPAQPAAQPAQPVAPPEPVPAPEPESAPAPEPAKEQTPQAPTPDLLDSIKENWTELRQYVGTRNKVAEIMLTEASVLGMEDSTLVIGHNTGALAQRINSERNNADIVAAFSEKLGMRIAVKCVVGTDPQAAGFSSSNSAPEVWNPAPQSQQTKQQAKEPDPEPEPEPEPAAPRSGWGAPVAIPGQQSAPSQPATPVETPPPAQPKHPEPASSQDDWRAVAAQAAQRAAEREKAARDEIPLPPEPMDDAPPPPDMYEPAAPSQPQAQPPQQPPAPSQPEPQAPPQPTAPTQPQAPAEEYSQEAEERDMVDQTKEPAQFDRRDATAVAMELLERELGAKPL